MFVIADSDWIGDEAIKVPGNGVLALDVIHWLMGDEAFSGQTSTEADVKITHTRSRTSSGSTRRSSSPRRW